MTRVAVVTGAAGGIGVATCDLLRERGWDVIPVDIRPIDRPNALQIDLTDAASLTAALGALRQVDGLVNNGAIQLFKSIQATTVEEWDLVAATNIRSAFVCTRAVYAQLIASQGAVVNIGSVHALATSTSISAYAAAKGGIAAFTRAAALELAQHQVRANAVLPGAVDTPALREGFSRREDAEASLIRNTPLQRVGAPTDVAEAIEFLLDRRRSGFITGQHLVVDGGALARLSTE